MQPERLADGSADSIAFHTVAGHFDRNCQAESGCAMFIELQRDAEKRGAKAPTARMNSVELRLAADTSLGGQGVTNAIRGAGNQWPTV